MKITLQVEQGPDVGQRFEFNEPDTFIVGRSKTADVKLGKGDPYISRRHFLLQIAPPHCYISDMHSTNPPEVNGGKIETGELKELHDGDLIKAGMTEIRVRMKGDLEPPPSLPDSEAVTLLFDDSEQKTWKLPPQRPPGPSFPAVCLDCRKDLSAQANTDGRAEELQDIALYLCDECAEKRKQPTGIDMISDYRVLWEIGKGRIGIVYAALHTSTNRLTALKKVSIKEISKHAMQRFLRGMESMKQMNHPNLVRFLGQGIHQGEHYLVSEYLDGGNARQIIIDRYKGPLPPKIACQIMIDVLKGLEYLHQQGHVHRAISPTNILLPRANDDGVGTAKLADFGLAKSYSDAGGPPITDPGEQAGPILYMAPEQIADFKHAQPTGDVYSAGVSLYELLTVKLPFPQQSHQDPVLIVLEEKPIPIREANPTVHKFLAHIVDKAVRKDVSERFQSAADLREELEMLIDLL
jgi:serine/threonine-protein kinase